MKSYARVLLFVAGVLMTGCFTSKSGGGGDSGSGGGGGNQGPQPTIELSASMFGQTGVLLSWKDIFSDEDQFEVERGPDGTNFAHLATLVADSVWYLDLGLSWGTTYFYRVLAKKAGNLLGISNVLSVTPGGGIGGGGVGGFNKHLGTAATEVARSMTATSDGGFVTASTYSSQPGSATMLLIKFNNLGQIQWQKSPVLYGIDNVASIVPSASGYYVAGSTQYTVLGTPVAPRGFVLQLDAQGNTQWARIFTRFSFSEGAPFSSVVPTSDGGAIAAGTLIVGSKHGLLVRYASTGTVVWARQFNTGGSETISDITATQDGGYAFLGKIEGPATAFVGKIDANGVFQWANQYAGAAFDNLVGLKVTPDGGLAFGGSANSDLDVSKLDAQGNLSWSRSIGTGALEQELGFSVQPDGSFLVSGVQSNGNNVGLIASLDPSGNVAWARAFTGAGQQSVRRTDRLSDGNLVAFGDTTTYTFGSHDLAVIKLTAQGSAGALTSVQNTNLGSTPLGLGQNALAASYQGLSYTLTVGLTPSNVSIALSAADLP